MPRAFLILLLLAAPALAKRPQLRCRIVAIAGAKVKTGPWQAGIAGCQTVRKDAEFAANVFGDVVIYKLQIQSGGHEMFVRLDMDDSTPAKDAPRVVQ